MRSLDHSTGSLLNHVSTDVAKVRMLFAKLRFILHLLIALFGGYSVMYLFVGWAILGGIVM